MRRPSDCCRGGLDRAAGCKVTSGGSDPIADASAKRQMGDSPITVTVDRYGHFERDASRSEAANLEGAYGV